MLHSMMSLGYGLHSGTSACGHQETRVARFTGRRVPWDLSLGVGEIDGDREAGSRRNPVQWWRAQGLVDIELGQNTYISRRR